jgi:hypothetical protein
LVTNIARPPGKNCENKSHGCLTELGKPVPGDRSLTVAAL